MERMVIESIEKGIRGWCRFVFFSSLESTFLAGFFVFVKAVHLNGQKNVLCSMYSGNAGTSTNQPCPGHGPLAMHRHFNLLSSSGSNPFTQILGFFGL